MELCDCMVGRERKVELCGGGERGKVGGIVWREEKSRCDCVMGREK